MNDKLVRRTALKYHYWLIEANKPHIDKYTLLAKVNAAIVKSEEMMRWSRRFIRVFDQRIQINKWEPKVEHKGIINSSVYEKIATKMIPDLGKDAIQNIEYATNMLKAVAKPNEITPLSMKESIEEIKIINDAWEVEFRGNRLSVLIKDVTLSDGNEEVDLGSFIASLSLTDPIKGLAIISLDETESNGGYYHPHVKNEKLCTGDGKDAMIDALSQGRLEDYFRIVETIIRTYNETSPHEELNEWYGPDHEDEFFCLSCEDWRSDDMQVYCEKCDTINCDVCIENCGGGICEECNKYCCENCAAICRECNGLICNDCADECEQCNHDICSECRSTCANCDITMCDSCSTTCGCCSNNYCEECIDEDKCCNDCTATICEQCTSTCEGCDKTICDDCKDNECEYCGVKMCEDCKEEHNCVLAVIDN